MIGRRGGMHTGRYCLGKRSLRTFIDGPKLGYDRYLARIQPTSESANTVVWSAWTSDQVSVGTGHVTAFIRCMQLLKRQRRAW